MQIELKDLHRWVNTKDPAACVDLSCTSYWLAAMYVRDVFAAEDVVGSYDHVMFSVPNGHDQIIAKLPDWFTNWTKREANSTGVDPVITMRYAQRCISDAMSVLQ